MEPNLPLPGLIPLSWVFLGPFGRLYCQHLPPILAQGPPRNGAKPALTRADPLILGLSWALGRLYCQHLPPILAQGPLRNGPKPALTRPDLVILGLSGALGRLYCQHLPSILAQGPPRNGAKPALTRGPRAMEPNLPLPGLIPLSWVFLGPLGASIASIFPLSWPRGPFAMEPNLPLPGLISLSWVFLGPFGRLYCQHLPPILAQEPPRNGAKPALTRADPLILGLSWALWAPLLPASFPYLGPGAPAQWSQTCPYQG